MNSRTCAVMLGLALWMQMATAQPQLEDNRGGLEELRGANIPEAPEMIMTTVAPTKIKEDLNTPVQEIDPDGVCCLHEKNFQDVERLMLKARNGDLSLSFLSKKTECPADEILLPKFCCDDHQSLLKGQNSVAAQSKKAICTVDAWCQFLIKYVGMLGIPAPAEDWAVCSANKRVVAMWQSQVDLNKPKFRAEVEEMEKLMQEKSRSVSNSINV